MKTLQVKTELTIGGKVVYEVGRIKDIVFYAQDGSCSEWVILVQDGNVIGTIECMMSQGTGFISEIKEYNGGPL